MSPREVSRSELADQIPEILSGRNTIALVPHTADIDWAADATWQFARAVAAEYRSVTLIDLTLDARALDRGSPIQAEEGIVDAFLYGSSLAHVTVSEPDTGLDYVSAGTFTPDPGAIWGNSRWPQILAAFSRPHSIVIFFVPPEALAQLNVALDGIIVASPGGYNPRSETASQNINRAIASGIPLLRVVTGLAAEPATAAAPAEASAAPTAAGAAPVLRRTGDRAPWVYGALAVIAVASISYGVFGGRSAPDDSAATPAAASGPAPAMPGGGADAAADAVPGTPGDSPGGLATPSTADTAAGSSATATADRSPAAAAGFTPADSLFWGVQAASLNSADRANDYVARWNEGGYRAAVTPVRLATGVIWYRVIVGTEPDSAAAAALRTALWQTPLLSRPAGQVTRTPWALEADVRPAGDGAEAISGLRERGLSAYILSAADGTPRLFFGAFRTREQAGIADSILAASGITTTLVQRLGINR